jgi:hypothetical protein
MQDKIRLLSEQWNKATRSGKNFVYNANADVFELHNNGIEPHLLNHQDLILFGVETTKKLLFGNLGSITTKDNYLFWSWMCTLLLDFHHAPPPHPIRDNIPLYQLLETCAALALGENNHDIQQPRMHAGLALSYLSFPLMESLSRTILSEYLSIDGVVLQEFKAIQKTYKVNDRCSSLQHALHFAIEQIKNDELKIGLASIVENLEQFSEDNYTGYKYLFNLRNSALHAGKSPPTIGAYCFSISLLLALALIEKNYSEYWKWANVNVRHLKQHPHNRFSWQETYSKLYNIEGKGNEFG